MAHIGLSKNKFENNKVNFGFLFLEGCMRNFGSKNFGLRSRDMGRAGKNAQKERGNSFGTVNTNSDRFDQFLKFLDEKQPDIKDLRDIEREHVLEYGEHLKDQIFDGNMSPAYGQNLLSAVNTTLDQARQDKECHVDAVHDAGLPERSGITEQDHCVSKELHEETKDKVSDRLGALMDLQREFGLRFKESSLLDAKKCLEDIEKYDRINIDRGTKGGQSRELELHNKESQLEALQNAAKLQGDHDSMIPTDLTYEQFKNDCYNELKETDMNGFHGERHLYANDRYEQETGYPAPCRTDFKHGRDHLEHMAKDLGIPYKEAKELDHKARMEISEELGHHRLSVTNYYLG